MSDPKSLRLNGIRYRCVPMYVPADELDPLGRFFLQVLKYEHNVSRLIQSFDLPQRVIEDILGDLIRHNRATLVVAADGHKEVHPLDDAIPTVAYKPGDAIDVWQEHSTGLVLPAWVADQWARAGNDLEAYQISGESALIDDFLKAPDAQLIEMLVRSDPALRAREATNGTLDRLAHRFRVRPQAIWIPVSHIEVGDQKIPQIIAEDLPPWLARVWSVALRNYSMVSQAGTARFAVPDFEAENLVHGWRAGARLDAWRAAINLFLGRVPAPESGYELRDVRERDSALVGLFQSVGRVDVRPAPPGRHFAFEEVFEEARTWAALVLPWPGQLDELVEKLQARGEKALPDKLLVMTPEVAPEACFQNLRRIFGPSRDVVMILCDWDPQGPTLALSDMPVVRLQQAPSSDVVEFRGERLAMEWLMVLQGAARSQASAKDSHLHFQLLRVRRDSIPEVELARLGMAPSAPSVATALAELDAFAGTLLSAIVDPESVWRTTVAGAEEPADPPTFDRQHSLAVQLPSLSERLSDLVHMFALSPAAPSALWQGLTAYDLQLALAAVLTESQRRSVEGEITVLTSDGALGLADGLVSLLQDTIDTRGWTVRIGVSGPPTKDLARSLTKAASPLMRCSDSPRLKVLLLNRPVPLHALIIGEIVFIAGTDWLRLSRETEIKSSHFGFIFESHHLAETLRGTLAGGHELASAPVLTG